MSSSSLFYTFIFAFPLASIFSFGPYTHSPVFEFYFLNLFSLWSWLDWLDLVVMHLAVLRLNNVFVSFIRAWWSSYRTFPRCTGATRKWAYCWLKPTGWSLPSLMRPTTTRDDKQGAGEGAPCVPPLLPPKWSTELKGLYSHTGRSSLFLTSFSLIGRWAFQLLRDFWINQWLRGCAV